MTGLWAGFAFITIINPLKLRSRNKMNELNHLQLIEIATQNRTQTQQIIDIVTEARANHDGPAIAHAIGDLEKTYKALASMDDAQKRATRDRSLEFTRKRFGLGALRENRQLSAMGGTSLGRVIYHLERAMEGLDRWLSKIQNGQDFQADTQFSIDQIGEAIHWAYLICRPLEREAAAR
jgi:hypothetical protein